MSMTMNWGTVRDSLNEARRQLAEAVRLAVQA
jgi:hypothetical protein